MSGTKPVAIIEKALARGETALSEHDSKRLLAYFGIPVNREALASDAESAVKEAERIGFPVVLKASGTRLSHKSEVGGVVLNLNNAQDVREAGERLLKIEGCEALPAVNESVGGRVQEMRGA